MYTTVCWAISQSFLCHESAQMYYYEKLLVQKNDNNQTVSA